MKLKRIKFARIKSKYGENGELDQEHLQDMLRYDTAFINKADPTLIAFPAFHTPGGLLGGTITLDRWNSFGILVDVVTDSQRTFELSMMSSATDVYVTYRRVGADSNMVPVTLNQYKAAKSMSEINALLLL